MQRFKISGTGLAVPNTVQTADEIAQLVGRDTDWVYRTSGVATRHVCKPGDDPACLAAQAAQPVIERCGQPDLLIYASATHRQCVPDTSVFVARELGLEGVPAYSLNATCLSFLVAIQNTAALISAGEHKKVLIVTAEQPSLARDFSQAESAALLGDGAAAVMLEPVQQDAGLLAYQFKTWPQYAELAEITGGGHLRHPNFSSSTPNDNLFAMDGDQLMRAVLSKSRSFFEDLFAVAEIAPDDIDLFVPHQASAAGMRLLQRLGFPAERTVNIISKYGNCVSASMPMALATADHNGRLNNGDRILLLGSAAGLSIGAAIIRWA